MIPYINMHWLEFLLCVGVMAFQIWFVKKSHMVDWLGQMIIREALRLREKEEELDRLKDEWNRKE